MKIEKISENQIKFLLTNDDLKEREIKLTELAQGTEKAQDFFRDIMSEAMMDFGFDVTDTPLMIEAMPIAVDSVMIIVSKVVSDVDVDKVLSLNVRTLNERKFKQEGLIFMDNGYTSIEDDEEDLNIYIYSFKTLDEVTKIAKRVANDLDEKNELYKYNKNYFLLIEKPMNSMENLETILSEYGQKHVSNVIAKCHLEEHGEVMIKSDALAILSKI